MRTERPRAPDFPPAPDSTAILDERLANGVASLGLEIDGPTRARLLAFLQLLAKWNAVYNLTSVRDPADMLVVHLLDALSIVPVIDRVRTTTVLDVGSGAGLPAIPLAIARPELTVTSVDAVAKKVAFQRQAKAALSLARLTPIHGRVEDLHIDPPGVIVSRAYAELPAMLASIRHLNDDATTVIAMKGATPTHEIAAIGHEWSVVRVDTLNVPFLGAERCAVTIRRSGLAARTEQ